MFYKSTRNSALAVDSATAISQGISADGGLFVPSEIPSITMDEIRQLSTMRYADRAAYIFAKYLTDFTGLESVGNTLIADGCIIEGSVENSIIFRGVKVGRGSVVRNSILLQDTVVGSGVSLNCVVTDKNAVIRDGRTLSGHETMPFFIGQKTSAVFSHNLVNFFFRLGKQRLFCLRYLHIVNADGYCTYRGILISH